MKTKRLLFVLLCGLVLAACTAWQQGVTPGVTDATPTPGDQATMQTVGTTGHPAGHLIVRGVRPDTKCPRAFSQCVTISLKQPAQIYFCYSTGSYCGPSLPQYGWYWTFTNRQGQEVYFLDGSFNPNPGNPTYDTIGAAYGVRSTHGKYKYMQIVCPFLASSCLAYFYIGIAVK
jgi:hypothetical protein